MNIKVKILREGAHVPTLGTSGAAACDLYALLPEPIVLQPGERRPIPTGIAIALPSKDYVAIVCARSGLALKEGITVLNTPGTIDSDYRGEIGVILINCGTKSFLVKRGDRIAQMVINRYERINWCECEVLDETERADGGFGHSGV